ncbi:MAG: hypothetical protein MJE77_46395 [Proteobacteria bacterium]|nr:hypothetical protein [Pseudomonadota bacterium]
MGDFCDRLDYPIAVTYRDDLDATRARADALERELARARAEIAELKGETALAPVPDRAMVPGRGEVLERVSASGPGAQRWLGAPIRMKLGRVIEGELPEASYAELVEIIREAIGEPGTTSILPGSLTWTSAAMSNSMGSLLSIYVSVRDGVTTIRADEKLGHLAGAIYGGIGGGVGGGGFILPFAVMFINPLLLGITLPTWLGGTYLVCRKLYRQRALFRAERLETLMDRLAGLAERAIAEASRRSDTG